MCVFWDSSRTHTHESWLLVGLDLSFVFSFTSPLEFDGIAVLATISSLKVSLYVNQRTNSCIWDTAGYRWPFVSFVRVFFECYFRPENSPIHRIERLNRSASTPRRLSFPWDEPGRIYLHQLWYYSIEHNQLNHPFLLENWKRLKLQILSSRLRKLMSDWCLKVGNDVDCFHEFQIENSVHIERHI